jgi:hypothetical protein
VKRLSVVAVRKAGLTHVEDELKFVASKIKKLWVLHWRVHGDRYMKILSGLE